MVVEPMDNASVAGPTLLGFSLPEDFIHQKYAAHPIMTWSVHRC